MKISIITVCHNSEKYIEETINSVVVQTYNDIEYIIIDGGSTDGTISIIDRYIDKVVYFISEADSSMYDALNKGLAKASGDYILNLNSDDKLCSPNVIEEVIAKLGRARPDAFYCDLVKDYGFGVKKMKLSKTSFEGLLASRHGSFVPHPVFFISHKVNGQLEGYDLNYKHASDFDYILRVLENPAFNIIHLPVWCVVFRVHSFSQTGLGKVDKERLDILEKFKYVKLPAINRLILYYYGWGNYFFRNIGSYLQFYLKKNFTKVG